MLKLVTLWLLVALCYSKSVAFISICHESFLDPLLSIAQTFQQRNPETKVSIYSGEFCRSRTVSSGLTFVNVGSQYLNSTMVRDLNLIASPNLPPQDANLAYTQLILKLEPEMTAELLKVFNSGAKPDCIVTNYGTYAAFNLADVLDVPLVIYLDALYQADLFSNEDIYSTYLPTEGFKTAGEVHQSTFQRTYSVFNRLLSRYYFNSEVLTLRNSVRSALSLPLLSSTFSRSSPPLYLVRSFFGVELSRAIPPNFIMTGNPSVLEVDQPNDDGLIEWMNESTAGFLYFSTGSIYDLSIREHTDVLNAFFKMNINALVAQRSFHETIHKQNTRGQRRVNLQEVMKHKNLKLVITNGELDSIYEAIQAQVPIICIPFSSDQFKNCQRLASSNSAIYLDRAYITTEVLLENIKAALNTPEYKENIQKKAKMIKHLNTNQRTSEVLEMVLDVGYDHLVPSWYELSWCKRYNLDVYGYVFGALGFMLIGAVKTVSWILASEKEERKDKRD